MLPHDSVDEFVERWQVAAPALDSHALALIGLMGRLRRVTAVIDRELATVMRRHGLQIGESEVLVLLRQAEPNREATPTGLAQRLMVSPGGMTNRLDGLERAGLVTRVVNPDSRRSLSVRLTPEGIELVDRTMRDLGARLESLLGQYRDADRERLEHALRSVYAELTREGVVTHLGPSHGPGHDGARR